ncbi:MAG: hypothetical protein ABSD74_10960 [Rhizomicrobium sp.]|jgi:hypothetical protein
MLCAQGRNDNPLAQHPVASPFGAGSVAGDVTADIDLHGKIDDRVKTPAGGAATAM